LFHIEFKEEQGHTTNKNAQEERDKEGTCGINNINKYTMFLILHHY
jgi:hypothetical protein